MTGGARGDPSPPLEMGSLEGTAALWHDSPCRLQNPQAPPCPLPPTQHLPMPFGPHIAPQPHTMSTQHSSFCSQASGPMSMPGGVGSELVASVANATMSESITARWAPCRRQGAVSTGPVPPSL